MRIGFTGSRIGMTNGQSRSFKRLIDNMVFTEFHHGDCIGADQAAHDIVEALYGRFVIYIHPPINKSKRAYCQSPYMFPPKPYIERSHDIVNSCDVLIATPEQEEEIRRSGTWATVRYAIRQDRPVTVILPTGEITHRSSVG